MISLFYVETKLTLLCRSQKQIISFNKNLKAFNGHNYSEVSQLEEWVQILFFQNLDVRMDEFFNEININYTCLEYTNLRI